MLCTIQKQTLDWKNTPNSYSGGGERSRILKNSKMAIFSVERNYLGSQCFTVPNSKVLFHYLMTMKRGKSIWGGDERD